MVSMRRAACQATQGAAHRKTPSPGRAQWQKWIMARSTRLSADWRPIDTAPWEEDVTLLVTDGRGEPYLIPYPCKRTADSGWLNSSRGTPLAVMPLQWKPYVSRLKKR
jgi:hypothetical protein